MCALRLMAYDSTCAGRRVGAGLSLPGLTTSWVWGGLLYQKLGRLDGYGPATSWGQALQGLLDTRPSETISEIQYWGHGKWGQARVADDVFDIRALEPGHRLYDRLCAVRDRLSGPDALFWFRTCETFGAHSGHRFAVALAEFLGCRVAGHTFIIGPWQSGLHSLSPGQRPTWSVNEGLAAGESPAKPRQALWSKPGKPNTIHCLQGTIPAGY